jgi:hypothetical protein
MQLSSRSLLLVLSLGMGCGPHSVAAREIAANGIATDDLPQPGSGGSGPAVGTGGAGGGGGSPGSAGQSVAGRGGSPATGGAPGTGGASVAPSSTGGAPGTGGFVSQPGGSGGGSGGNAASPDGGTPSGSDTLGSVAAALPVTAADLLASLGTCDELTNGRYAADDGGSASIAICGLPEAVFWKADMDINCNGKSGSSCNADTDPGYRPETAGKDSQGVSLNAATLPFVVIPAPSARFDHSQHGVELGSVVAVIYKGQIEYGVVGEIGAAGIIGEASFAMAKKLGIDPDPATGGVGSGVTYVVFSGAAGRVAKLEDRAETVRIGLARAQDLVSPAR